MRAKAILGLLLAAALACGGCPTGSPTEEGPPRARITTSMGEFLLELDDANAPVTVQNFLQYVDEGFYDGTIFHRVIPNFIVQGGGFLPGMVEQKPTHDPIVSEAYNGLLNLRGTVGMARADDPDSATSQFYVNLADNSDLDPSLTSPGYTVFGRVIEGMDVVDAISLVPTETREDYADVPVDDVVLVTAKSEPGEPVVTPSWQAYFDYVQYNLQSTLRDVAIQLFQALMTQ